MLRPRGNAGEKKGLAPSSVFSIMGKLTQASLRQPPLESEVPMLKVAHPWIKNRNVIEGETVFSFNGDGIAVVKDLGNARVDLQRLMKKPTSKFSILEDPREVPKVEVPVLKVEAPKVPVSKIEVPSTEIEAPASEVFTSTVLELTEPEEETTSEVEDKATKRTPTKKKSGGK
jgi:hypothetical protein